VLEHDRAARAALQSARATPPKPHEGGGGARRREKEGEGRAEGLSATPSERERTTPPAMAAASVPSPYVEDVEDGEIEGAMLDTTILASSVQQGQDVSKNVGKLMYEIQNLVTDGDVREHPQLETREACAHLVKALQKTISVQRFNLEQDTHRKPRRIIGEVFTKMERVWQRTCTKGRFGSADDKGHVANMLALAVKDGPVVFEPSQRELLTHMHSVLQKSTDSPTRLSAKNAQPTGSQQVGATLSSPSYDAIPQPTPHNGLLDSSAAGASRVPLDLNIEPNRRDTSSMQAYDFNATSRGVESTHAPRKGGVAELQDPLIPDDPNTETWDCVCVPCGYARILGFRAPSGSTPAQIRAKNADASMIKTHLGGKRHTSNAGRKPADLCLEWVRHEQWLARKKNEINAAAPNKRSRVDREMGGKQYESLYTSYGVQEGRSNTYHGQQHDLAFRNRPRRDYQENAYLSPASTSESPPEGEDEKAEGCCDAPLSPSTADKARRFDEVRKMLFKRKLCLVLDLDHTLLNSIKVTDLSPEELEAIKRVSDQEAHLPVSKRTLHYVPELNMWTKLRPGVQNFLDITSRLYNLHVYTMGTKAYAHLMAGILDPKNNLFQGRIISRGDDAIISEDNRSSHVKDFEGVMGLETAALVIDDTDQVWPNHPDNLITIERYVYFSASGRKLGHQGLSLLARDCDESAESGQLAIILRLLANIHSRVFGALERSCGSSKWPPTKKGSVAVLPEASGCWDVREILQAERKTILKNVKILFSRIFPLHVVPEEQPLWRLAECLGATCVKEMAPDVTHVVAESRVTDKAVWAERTGKFLVTADWLRCCSVLWKRESETNFPVLAAH